MLTETLRSRYPAHTCQSSAAGELGEVEILLAIRSWFHAKFTSEDSEKTMERVRVLKSL